MTAAIGVRLYPCGCPLCGARRGEPCRTPSGRKAHATHGARLLAEFHGRYLADPPDPPPRPCPQCGEPEPCDCPAGRTLPLPFVCGWGP